MFCLCECYLKLLCSTFGVLGHMRDSFMLINVTVLGLDQKHCDCSIRHILVDV